MGQKQIKRQRKALQQTEAAKATLMTVLASIHDDERNARKTDKCFEHWIEDKVEGVYEKILNLESNSIDGQIENFVNQIG